ncbi:hypothetical protein J2046_001254 [Rhizobium petrolearium]|uniref:hypothetical protein n=1 Tax=Neorhizobium petrolearium TaxID=515361 RepID=UPI001F27347A|nr:hypothetical protein [Neorhizobium petrolearium]MBP1843000.1 hypothetical protein [Neorhizobium petrolearium]
MLEHGWGKAWEAPPPKRTATAMSAAIALQISLFCMHRSILNSFPPLPYANETDAVGFDLCQTGWLPIKSKDGILSLPAGGRSRRPFGAGVDIAQAGVRDVIPGEACYLGWQEALRNLARLVEPEINE